ncbi:hypothetical protein PYW07_012879 [Mythimna separata]|uniref:SH3 domain-containing protein n=1 Tax=Mythimna separata TaxID=271217 RepID=A0AAD7Y966_MYTSE|nr:hypothetical protein PYW07_012879 [Mythimna separata]
MLFDQTAIFEFGADDGILNSMEAFLKQLREQVEAAKALVEIKKQDQETNKSQLSELSNTVVELDEKFSRVWKLYEEKREEYLARSSAPAESAWSGAEVDWETLSNEATADDEEVSNITATIVEPPTAVPRWRCVLQFAARFADEISLQPGDLAYDAPDPLRVAEPGWLWLEAKGQAGWYPESYVEEIIAIAPAAEVSDPVDVPETADPVRGTDTELSNEGAVSSDVTEAESTTGAPRWRCMFEFTARIADELSLQPGDLASDVPAPSGAINPGFIYLTAAGGSGWFPRSHLADINAVAASAGPEAEINDNSGGTANSAATEAVPTTSAPRWRCLREFRARFTDELSLQPGELACDGGTPPRDAEPGWLWLTARGQSGWFPASFAQDVDAPIAFIKFTVAADAPEPELNNNSEGTLTSTAPEDPTTTTTTAHIWRCVREFKARFDDELSLQPGDLASDAPATFKEPGWKWLTAKGQTGWFPESYVRDINAPAPAASAEVSDPVLAARTTIGGDFCIAVHPYQSQVPGDLVFATGDRIQVIKRDGDWWTGRLANSTGIFLSHYVTRDPTSTAEAPTGAPAADAESWHKILQTHRPARRTHRHRPNRLTSKTDRTVPEQQNHENRKQNRT